MNVLWRDRVVVVTMAASGRRRMNIELTTFRFYGCGSSPVSILQYRKLTVEGDCLFRIIHYFFTNIHERYAWTDVGLVPYPKHHQLNHSSRAADSDSHTKLYCYHLWSPNPQTWSCGESFLVRQYWSLFCTDYSTPPPCHHLPHRSQQSLHLNLE